MLSQRLRITMLVTWGMKMLNYCLELKIIRFDWLFDVIIRLQWTLANKIRFHQCLRQISLRLTPQRLNRIFHTGNSIEMYKIKHRLSCELNFRAPSPLPRGPHSMAAACASPIESLPHTVFPNDFYQQQHYQPYQSAQPKPEQHVNYPPPPPPRTCFSPQLTRDHFQSNDEENASIQNQVSRRPITPFHPFWTRSCCKINDFTHGWCSQMFAAEASWPNFITNPPHETECLFTERKIFRGTQKKKTFRCHDMQSVELILEAMSRYMSEALFYQIHIEMSCWVTFSCNNCRAINPWRVDGNFNLMWLVNSKREIFETCFECSRDLAAIWEMMSQLQAICNGIKCFING